MSLKDFLDELGQVGRVVQPCFAIVTQILNLRWHGARKLPAGFAPWKPINSLKEIHT